MTKRIKSCKFWAPVVDGVIWFKYGQETKEEVQEDMSLNAAGIAYKLVYMRCAPIRKPKKQPTKKIYIFRTFKTSFGYTLHAKKGGIRVVHESGFASISCGNNHSFFVAPPNMSRDHIHKRVTHEMAINYFLYANEKNSRLTPGACKLKKWLRENLRVVRDKKVKK